MAFPVGKCTRCVKNTGAVMVRIRLSDDAIGGFWVCLKCAHELQNEGVLEEEPTF